MCTRPISSVLVMLYSCMPWLDSVRAWDKQEAKFGGVDRSESYIHFSKISMCFFKLNCMIHIHIH